MLEGRREREGEEIVFSEGERYDDRLKRERKNKKVNRRTRKQKKKKLQQKVRPYAAGRGSGMLPLHISSPLSPHSYEHTQTCL